MKLLYNDIMYGRRGGGVFFWWIFFIFIIGGGFFDLFFDVVLPVAFMGLFGFGMYKLFKAIFDSAKKAQKDKEKEAREKASNAEMARVDTKLKNYFHDNLRLYLTDDVCLMTSSGEYTGLSNLYLAYGSEKILKLSEFKNAYPDGFEKILDLLIAFSKQRSEKENKSSKAKKVTEEEDPTPKKATKTKSAFQMSKADEYIKEINKLNDAIPHEEISNGLDQTCQLLKQIDLATNEKGKDDSKLNKLYDYYLPILIQILNKYRELNDSPVHGEEFVDCENQLMKTILLINQALKTLHGSLHAAEYMDLNADIETLQTILKKDGLVDGNPFGGK